MIAKSCKRASITVIMIENKLSVEGHEEEKTAETTVRQQKRHEPSQRRGSTI